MSSVTVIMNTWDQKNKKQNLSLLMSISCNFYNMKIKSQKCSKVLEA